MHKLLLGLHAALELRVRSNIVVGPKVSNGDILAAAPVELIIGSFNAGSSGFVETIGAHGVHHLVEGDLAVTVGVEVFEESCHLVFTDLNTVGLHAELEFSWVDEAIAISVEGFEKDTESSKTIGSRLLSADLNNSLSNVAEVGDSAFLLDVGVTNIEVFADRLSEVHSLTLLLKVDVTIVAAHRLRVVSRLSETTSSGEGV